MAKASILQCNDCIPMLCRVKHPAYSATIENCLSDREGFPEGKFFSVSLESWFSCRVAVFLLFSFFSDKHQTFPSFSKYVPFSFVLLSLFLFVHFVLLVPLFFLSFFVLLLPFYLRCHFLSSLFQRTEPINFKIVKCCKSTFFKFIFSILC